MSPAILTLEDVYEEETGEPRRAAMTELWKLMESRLTDNDKHTNISHRQMPTWEEHERYVTKRPYVCWYLGRVAGATAGAVHITQSNEIGIVVTRDLRRCGFAQSMLVELFKRHKPLPEIKGKRPAHFVANIVPSNTASIRLFEKFGARHLQNTYELHP